MAATPASTEHQAARSQAEQRAAYLARLQTQIAATMAANDPLAAYLTTLIQQIALEAWDAGYRAGQGIADRAR